MSLSIPAQITTPFADSGLKVPIPASSDNVNGRAGYDQGFPAINMTPKSAGGIPPFGTDMNGILYDITKSVQFLESGAGFVYDSGFSTAVGGYRVGSRVMRSDGTGYWLNTVDGNTTDPESAGAAAAGWVPDYTNGITSVTMTNANVTLTAAQYGKPIIVITGTLTANLNLIFPQIAASWIVFNNTTGAFSVSAKTATGAGLAITQGQCFTIFCDGTNAVRSSTASTLPPADGSVSTVKLADAAVTTAKLAAGTVTAAKMAAGAAVANIGYTPVNKTGDTMTGPLVLNANPAAALGAATKQYVDASGDQIRLSSLGYGQTWQDVGASRGSGVTYYNTTGKPIVAKMQQAVGAAIYSITVSGVQVAYLVTAANTNGECAAVVPPGAAYSYSYSAGIGIRELR